MKGKRWFIVLLALFTISGLSLSVYSNANASVNIDGYRLTTDTLRLTQSNSYQVYITGTNAGWVNGTYTWDNQANDYIGIAGIRTTQSFSVEENKIYKLTASFFYRGPYSVVVPGALIQTLNSNDYFKLVAIEPVQCENINGGSGISDWVGYSCIYDFYVQSKTTSTRQIFIGLTNNSVMLFLPAFTTGIMTMAQDISIFEPITDGAEELNQKDDEDRENIETQQEETSEQAEDTSSDVQGATTNIIGVISGFSSALNNIQTGNCTLPTISAYGFSLGNINLCTYSPPSWVQGAVSIVVSFITLKLAIAVFYRIMGALDGVIGGKK